MFIAYRKHARTWSTIRRSVRSWWGRQQGHMNCVFRFFAKPLSQHFSYRPHSSRYNFFTLRTLPSSNMNWYLWYLRNTICLWISGFFCSIQLSRKIICLTEFCKNIGFFMCHCGVTGEYAGINKTLAKIRGRAKQFCWYDNYASSK